MATNERFTFNPKETTISQCMYCKHKKLGATCAAFTDEIPIDILTNEFDHQNPYPDDNGIRFELREDLSKEVVEAIK